MYRIPIYKIALIREKSISANSRQIASPGDVAPILSAFFGEADREHFAVIMLSTKRHIIGINTISIGSLNSSLVHPREIFKPAILSNSSAIILGHNHPSGDPAPSPEDIEITKHLIKAGELLGIEILDHIIIGDGCYYDMKSHGVI